MAVDYDLVIIGSSWAGIYAAKNAVRLQARVALVTQSDELFLPNDTLFNHSVSEAGRLNQIRANPMVTASDAIPAVSLSQVIEWAKGINYVMQTGSNSLSNLAALGVDVISGKGKFCRLPQLSFKVNNRKLRSRNYLLATGANFVPQFSGADAADSYLTLRNLGDRDLSNSRTTVVIGGDPTALELAQTLARFKQEVTLIVEQPRILPQEDLDIALLLQAQLEADGIEVYANVKISQIQAIDGQKWLQVGDRALSADEIIIVDYRQPNVAGLNLAGVNVKCDRQKVLVNQKLQTANPKIYACGELIGGYSLPNVARHEINLILKNTLFLPWYKVNYYSLPWAILTRPNLARVGLTERQARLQYGEEIYVIKQNLKDIAQAQISDRTTGMCKLLVASNGTIVGCSLVCDRAAELITTVALMMQHNIRLDRNPMRGLTDSTIPTIYPGMAEILQQASNNYYQQKLQRNPRLVGRLRTWFSLRKDWH